MGSRLAAELVAAGNEVFWVPEGRSPASSERAAAAGLTGTSFADAVGRAELVLCSCAPQGAVAIARQVGATGFTGLYVDANPLSPSSLAEAAEALAAATFVDAGVIGPPPIAGSRTDLLLAGPSVEVVADLFTGTAVSPRVVGTTVGAASAAKSAFALYNKGKRALAVLAFGLADHHGVTDALVAQSTRKQAGDLGDPSLPEDLRKVAWRWGPEFDEIAETLTAAGLDAAPIQALREVWTRLS
ncbi:DUF1932 domain-containing protein [Kribbella sp. NBC_01245]|uniref:DUF1932 domain-containing protein n=1 Tax=Kribbella sp. NBC_01245 TaxID=2903578 RepID=UPI002E2A8651|nr:DUF1932 domain-containing protein [Kribbella sp. NBC_01245]